MDVNQLWTQGTFREWVNKSSECYLFIEPTHAHVMFCVGGHLQVTSYTEHYITKQRDNIHCASGKRVDIGTTAKTTTVFQAQRI